MTHEDRVYHHMYETNEGIAEHAERIASLEELVRDVWHLFTEHGAVHPCDLPVVDAVRERMRELEVGYE